MLAAMRTLRTLEFVALYFVLPAVFAYGRPGSPLPVLWLVAVLCGAWLLRRPGWSAARLCGWMDRPGWVRGWLIRTALIAAVLAAGLFLFAPGLWLSFPRQRPGWWAAVVLLYPVFSVFPQGVVYRAFFHERYAALFGTPTRLDLAAALVFAYGHIIFRNPVAVAFTLVGGWLFFRTYRRTGCLQASNLEHAVLGDLLFTLGYGAYFFHRFAPS